MSKYTGLGNVAKSPDYIKKNGLFYYRIRTYGTKARAEADAVSGGLRYGHKYIIRKNKLGSYDVYMNSSHAPRAKPFELVRPEDL